jgi:pimeloyl-ACP methyl ester carboxylesterase
LAVQGFASVAMDQRGHGLSDMPDGGYDFDTLTEDLLAVIDRLGLDRPVVVGQSWGGNVVLELAARRADTIRGIVCVDGGWLDLGRQFADWDACRSALAPPRESRRVRVISKGGSRSLSSVPTRSIR